MKREVLIGESNLKDLLFTAKNGTLISEVKGTNIVVNKAILLNGVETVNKETGEAEYYDTLVMETDKGLIRVPNKVAVDTLIRFIDSVKEAGYTLTTVTICAEEIKADSGNKYIDFVIVDFTCN